MSSSKGQITPSSGPIVRCGHLRKCGSLISGLKPLKKKYFVLRGETPGHPACLEYYDNKKKFDNKQPPKRSITMRSCYNINRKNDSKHKHVIALYTKDDCFSLILDNDKEVEEWLTAMLLLSGDVPDGEQPRPTFEHVWQVTLQKKGLGERKNLYGPYRLCLTDRVLSLIKVGAEDNSDCLEFPLTTIRRCGCMDRIFYMEVGRSAVTGEGDYWMKAEDSNITQNMHTAILNAMSSSSSNKDKDDMVPKQRMRSSSANEASKPISVLGGRRYTGHKLHGFSPLGPAGRDRCDSLPSRARTTSEGLPAPIMLAHPRTSHLTPHATRPHSMYSRGLSYSPPVSSMPISPASGACSTDSAGSSLSMDDGTDSMLEESTTTRYGHSLTPDEPVILEENMDDYVPWSSNHLPQKYSPNFKSHSSSQQSSYVEMYSPCGSSPGRGGVYLPMSPATTVHSHSRASSLVEEATLPDGYVPMAPVGDEYVDMDPTNGQNGHYHDELSQHGSSCSVTSGTPSTDLRFIEYPLDKVSSYLTPSEDDPSRPTRAYSVGSRPEQMNRHRKNRLDFVAQEATRVRAFSVGSRSKRSELGRLVNVVTAKLPSGGDNVNSHKSNSAPLLSSSWGHNSGCSMASDRMEDLMELDFSRSNVPTTLSSTPSSYTQSHSHSHSYSADTSSYMDMSPGQPHTSSTAPYVDMSGNKMSRNNNINNNNNNNTTANHNHNSIHATSLIHKPVMKPLKPVVETEGLYLKMENSLDNWPRSGTSPKQQASSPLQEDYMEMNGPPGVMRTAPVDLPQPRKPPEGYVEMNFKPRPSLEQNYINMTMGVENRNRRKPRQSSRKDKSQRSQPIAIQASNKLTKTPSFLPLNGGSTSDSLASTPATPSRATPTGSTIFPFSLNSPQSPIKPFTPQEDISKTSTPTFSDCSPEEGDYAAMTPGISSPMVVASASEFNSKEDKDCPPSPTLTSIKSTSKLQDSPLSPLSKRLTELTVSKKKSRNNTNPVTTANSLKDSLSEGSKPTTTSAIATSTSTTTPITTTTTLENTKSLKRERECEKPPSPIGKEKGSQQEMPQSPVAKKLSELSVSKTKLINSSPNTSPTPTSGLKIPPKTNSPKIPDDITPTPSATPTPTPSPLDSEGYEKLQPGAKLLHYASLDLPESSSVPPVSPTPAQDGFRYAEIDFAKLKQN
ncbi:insulin receptor substrate 1-like isoform X2 [Chelonus insularis]|uniref:insulin receptor substrate 1-like isoform X2 n=1 Tax=Chelonus insularis TaxID=460826 RepID=UPI00158F0F93|nr:insulin receptor substrate 1-like isoform X2 [Chelonus insularis]